ncbi:mechanosensitive ion channel [Candidatus Woesearchaeota archaeon]|nr:mechanosensitive ion channel [Candidatus Woesearchaeota archaeon]
MFNFENLKKGINYALILLFIILIALYLYITIPQIASSFPEFYSLIKEKFYNNLSKIVIVLAIILATGIFIRFTLSRIKATLEKKDRKQDILLFNVPYRVFIWFIVILISLSIMFKNFVTLIASIGLIGFGVTFALQKPILNFVGWLTIITKRPYWIGDRVMIGNVKGDVFDMNIMYTSLSEFSYSGDEPAGRAITIPNEYVLTQPIINYTKGSPFIWDVIELTITYQSDWKEAAKIMEEAASEIVGQTMEENAEKWKQHKQKFTILGKDIVDKPIVRLEFSENFIKVRCHYIIESRKRGVLRSQIADKILDKIKKTKNITIAVNKTYIP